MGVKLVASPQLKKIRRKCSKTERRENYFRLRWGKYEEAQEKFTVKSFIACTSGES